VSHDATHLGKWPCQVAISIVILCADSILPDWAWSEQQVPLTSNPRISSNRTNYRGQSRWWHSWLRDLVRDLRSDPAQTERIRGDKPKANASVHFKARDWFIAAMAIKMWFNLNLIRDGFQWDQNAQLPAEWIGNLAGAKVKVSSSHSGDLPEIRPDISEIPVEACAKVSRIPTLQWARSSLRSECTSLAGRTEMSAGQSGHKLKRKLIAVYLVRTRRLERSTSAQRIDYLVIDLSYILSLGQHLVAMY